MRSNLIDTMRKKFSNINERLIFVKLILDSFENFTKSTKVEMAKKDADGDSILGDLVSEYLNLSSHDSQLQKLNICASSISLIRALENLNDDVKKMMVVHRHPVIDDDSRIRFFGSEREEIRQYILDHSNDPCIKFYGMDVEFMSKPWDQESLTHDVFNKVCDEIDYSESETIKYISSILSQFLITCNSFENMILSINRGGDFFAMFGAAVIEFIFTYDDVLNNPDRCIKAYQSMINNLQLFGYNINPDRNIYLKMIHDATGIEYINIRPGYRGNYDPNAKVIMMDEQMSFPIVKRPPLSCTIEPMKIMNGRMCGGMGHYLYFGDCFYKPNTNFKMFMDEDEMKLIVNKAINVTEDDVREYVHLSPDTEVNFSISDKAYMSLYSGFIQLRKFILFSSNESKAIAQWGNLIGVLFTSKDKNKIYMVSLDTTNNARKVAQFELDLSSHTYQLVGEINSEDGEDE